MSSAASNSLKLIVTGASGRMGQQVMKLAEDMDEIAQAYPVKRFKNFKEAGDLVVDFSLPEAISDLVQYCETTKTPLVSGTTGLAKEQMDQLCELSKTVPVLWSPNMSLGVMVVTQFFKEMKVLADWTFKISETHHIHKKDSPSGTALRLQQALEEAIGRQIETPESIREGEVIGDHRITASGPFEEISIEHRAVDRRIFAQGALQAGLWLVKQKPGFYSLKDML